MGVGGTDCAKSRQEVMAAQSKEVALSGGPQNGNAEQGGSRRMLDFKLANGSEGDNNH